MERTGGGDIRLILMMAGLVALLFLKGAPAGLPPVDAAPPAGAFNAPRAIERLTRILGDEAPHPADSPANDALRERLIAEIEALGYRPQIRDDFTCNGLAKWRRIVCARVRNIVFRAGPATGKAVMVAAHYDSVPAGPGAADDGLGVAVSLEIAALLAETPPTKPVIFLLTDGEEMGLLGAHSFVETDPLADEIESVINIEARGVRGPGLMFETSIPNGRDVLAYVRGAARPFTNSLMTDIYRLLPNDTDVSEFLPKGYDAVNLALTEGVEFYHTPRDNLANLHSKSVQHVGRAALRSLDNFLRLPAGRGESHYAFVDILSRFSIVMPQWASAVLLAFGVIAAGAAFFRAGDGKMARAALTAPAIVAGAGLLAFALQTGVGALRPEAFYWRAHPEALRAIIYVSAVLAALAGVHFIASGAARARLYHAGWLWFALIGAAVFIFVPGAAILFALPLVFYAPAAIAAPRRLGVFAAPAIVVLLAIFLPVLFFIESGLGLAAAPVFAILAALIAAMTAPMALRDKRCAGLAPVAAAAIGLAFATGAALVVPAYSEEKPAPLNIRYFVDADARAAQWLIDAPDASAPETMQAIAPFKPADIEGLGDLALAADADYLETWPPEVMVLADESVEEGASERRLRIALIANGADALFLHIPEEARPLAVSSGRAQAEFAGGGDQYLYCVGRACDETVFDIRLGARESHDWHVFGMRYGLPRAAAPLVEARPDWASPIQNGDISLVRKKINI